MELYNLISETLISKGASFDKLVAQTYDGALNMSGCYNDLPSKAPSTSSMNCIKNQRELSKYVKQKHDSPGVTWQE